MAAAGRRAASRCRKRQDELAISGWAMEARLYAEDPAHEFLPSTGRLDHFVLGARASGSTPASRKATGSAPITIR